MRIIWTAGTRDGVVMHEDRARIGLLFTGATGQQIIDAFGRAVGAEPADDPRHRDGVLGYALSANVDVANGRMASITLEVGDEDCVFPESYYVSFEPESETGAIPVKLTLVGNATKGALAGPPAHAMEVIHKTTEVADALMRLLNP